jgi:hypothetical protein
LHLPVQTPKNSNNAPENGDDMRKLVNFRP